MGWFGSSVVISATLVAACGGRPQAGDTRSGIAATQGPEARASRAGDAEAAASAEPNEQVHAFMVARPGEISARVVGENGSVANATVHLVTQNHERTITTDDKGQFKAKVDEPTMIVVYGAQFTGSTARTQRIDGTEAIEIRDAQPPATPAKALSDPRIIPSYTSALEKRNAWARVWLLLEVGDTGAVSRVKLLNTPGFGIEPIAVRHAFKLEFEAARDVAGKPVLSQVFWNFDWPPSVWNRGDSFVRPQASRLPCRRTAEDTWYELNTPYRDCSLPNMANAISAPWVDAPKK